ncbi:AAA family ATPase [Sinorhizobium garamanticum]|uniref:AAA family ATPase n=1 Tax=Sinorhizobium garamanticum TaxID=680247 RepID=A0ABY8DJG0_9HYPH|nr:AAA family ATPase [Sinorhizobium garamanticum]WEX89665.1 AAA family ATPase [Sinorhizobium garamanticum]
MAGPERERKPAEGVRKTITILVADIVDSSRLSLTLDPEALRDLLARYFDEMTSIIQRHGGVVERYVGDEIMAVFGVPMLHEDDALRAVSAAVEMRDTLATLNHEFETDWGVQLAHRIGLNTGEVFTGIDRQGRRFLTGEALRVAKRLQEAAAANEILIGEATFKLVRHAVVVESSSPRAVKHGETFPAIILVSVINRATGFQRRFETPFVGRKRQRAMISTIFGDLVSNRACHLLTVLGEAGVGKSRLVSEVAGNLPSEMIVAHGRCLHYGDGITYWPLADIVREITRAGGDDPAKQSVAAIAEILAGVDKAKLIADRIAALLGFGEGDPGTREETFWAVRRLFEVFAQERPLVIVVEDLHWAEPTFLDLIEHLVDFSHGFPIVIVGTARPELLDTRPDWGGGKPNATTIALEPLSEAESRDMILNLLDRLPLSPAVESMITRAVGGNPLFAEELVAMLVDEELLRRNEDCWVVRSDLSELPVPLTINALLAARLEGLPSLERVILTAAAVEGAVFHQSAVNALACPVLDALEDGLLALVRRDLIRPEAPSFVGDKAYRFRHLLIRDAAYRSLPKNARADLHERFAAWLELTAKDRLREFEEIVGYHLEQAFLYHVALGPRDAHAASLAARACERLEAAGRRALVRSDLPAAINLLERVSHLLPTADPRRAALIVELGGALIESGRLAEAGRVLDDAERLAAAAKDERLASHVLIQRQFLRSLHGEEGGLEEAARAAATVTPVFERLGDDLGLCRARRLEAWCFFNEARGEAAAAAWERAAVHARRAGDRHELYESLRWIASMLWFGPTPAAEGIRRCEAMRAEVRESPESEAVILRQLACLNAIVGRFALARELIATTKATYADLGLTLFLAGSEHEAVVELLAGNPAAAEESARAAYRALEEMGERAFRSTMAATLALVVLEQGRDVEAEALAEVSARLGASGDLLTQIRWRRVRARVLARRAEIRAAEALAREALTIAEATDFINERADALVDLSHVLEASGRCDEAVAAASEAVHLYELKGNVVAAAATRLRLAKIVRI